MKTMPFSHKTEKQGKIKLGLLYKKEEVVIKEHIAVFLKLSRDRLEKGCGTCLDLETNIHV